jgi:hypothetical protein
VADLSPEYRLLTRCARQHLSEGDLAAIDAILVGPLDWGRVLHLAGWHRLHGFAWRCLRIRGRRERVPDRVRAGLAAAHEGDAERGVRVMEELATVLGYLAAEGIRVILLKGVALVTSVYEDPALRPMDDIDLLVGERDVARADRLLRSVGYEPLARKADPRVQARMIATHHTYPPLVGRRGIPVELHRDLVGANNPFRHDLTGMWSRGRRLSSAEDCSLLPSLEDLFLHLCINFYGDRLYSSRKALGQLCDISETARGPGALDWDFVREEALRVGLDSAVFLALFACAEVLGRVGPPDLLTTLRPSDFTPALGRLYINQRVLRARQWLPLEFLTPRKHPLRRLVSGGRPIRRADLPRAGPTPVRFYARRARTALGLLGRASLHPRETVQDLSLNLWLRSHRGRH